MVYILLFTWMTSNAMTSQTIQFTRLEDCEAARIQIDTTYKNWLSKPITLCIKASKEMK